MADKSRFSIMTYQRCPGHRRAAMTPHVHSGVSIRGPTTNNCETPDDYTSESEAELAAQELIRKL
jgi:hypothetical protein